MRHTKNTYSSASRRARSVKLSCWIYLEGDILYSKRSSRWLHREKGEREDGERGVGVREKEHGLKKKSQRERVCNEKLLRRENDDNNKRRKLHSAPLCQKTQKLKNAAG